MSFDLYSERFTESFTKSFPPRILPIGLAMPRWPKLIQLIRTIRFLVELIRAERSLQKHKKKFTESIKSIATFIKQVAVCGRPVDGVHSVD